MHGCKALFWSATLHGKSWKCLINKVLAHSGESWNYYIWNLVSNNIKAWNIYIFLGQHLIQRCVLVQRDEKGYGLTVTGDNPVYVQSVREGM